jgi:hypothetical protein
MFRDGGVFQTSVQPRRPCDARCYAGHSAAELVAHSRLEVAGAHTPAEWCCCVSASVPTRPRLGVWSHHGDHADAGAVPSSTRPRAGQYCSARQRPVNPCMHAIGASAAACCTLPHRRMASAEVLICAPLCHYCRRHATLVLHMAVPGLHLFYLCCIESG